MKLLLIAVVLNLSLAAWALNICEMSGKVCESPYFAELCKESKTCKEKALSKAENSGPQCAICKLVVNGMKSALADPNIMGADVICSWIGLCSLPRQSELAIMQCTLCRDSAKAYIKFVNSTVVMDIFRKVFMLLCSLDPGIYSSLVCLPLLDRYVENLFQNSLQTAVKPSDLCARVCVSSLLSKKVSLSVQSKPTVDACSLCQLIALYLEPYIQSTDQELAYANFLGDKVIKKCNMLPDGDGGYKKQCYRALSAILPHTIDPGIQITFLQYLKTESDLEKVCRRASMCPPRPYHKLRIGTCDVCEIVRSFLDPFDENKYKDIRSTLGTVCNLVPVKPGTDCSAVVNGYLGLGSDVLHDENPRIICSLLFECHDSRKRRGSNFPENTVPNKLVSGVVCFICEVAVAKVSEIQDNNATKNEILESFATTCSILPWSIQADCQKFIVIFGPQVVTLLDRGVDAKAICTDIKLCSKNSLGEPWKKIPNKY